MMIYNTNNEMSLCIACFVTDGNWKETSLSSNITLSPLRLIKTKASVISMPCALEHFVMLSSNIIISEQPRKFYNFLK